MNPERTQPELKAPGPSPDLLDRVKAGDQMAFGTVVRLYQPYAYALALRFVWNRSDAEDIVQESFVRVWHHIGSYRTETKFTTWLYAIVTRLSIDRIRSTQRREKIVVRYEPVTEVTDDADGTALHDGIDNAQLVAAVRDLVEQLPDAQRLIFTLRDLQDLPMDEVTLITGMSSTQVKANLWHARRRMRILLVQTGMTEER
jgi:RNA polymerase sigma-70 factor, ECF subfamily